MTQLSLQFDAASKATSQQRGHVYEAIVAAGSYGLTVDELSEQWGVPPNAISGRVTELKKDNRIVKIGTRRTRSGHAAAVLVSTEGRYQNGK